MGFGFLREFNTYPIGTFLKLDKVPGGLTFSRGFTVVVSDDCLFICKNIGDFNRVFDGYDASNFFSRLYFFPDFGLHELFGSRS